MLSYLCHEKLVTCSCEKAFNCDYHLAINDTYYGTVSTKIMFLGIFSILMKSLIDAGVKDFLGRLCFLTTDGASVNLGKFRGLHTFLRKAQINHLQQLGGTGSDSGDLCPRHGPF